MPKISVITPVYNVKAFIGKCATSLMRQTFEDVEYIFVDDASKDGSIAILEEIVEQYPENKVRILHHESNKGLPSSRKTGIEAATGEYVFNCDGDDWVEETLLEKMYAAVAKKDADYAYCDFYLTYENSERYMPCPTYSTADEALRKGYLGGAMKYNVWNKLIRRSLYEGVEFPVDHKKGGEDMVMFYVLSRAKSVAHVPEALYHYIKINANAISEKFSEQRLIDIQYNTNYAISSVRKNGTGNYETDIALFKLNVKLPFLITDDRRKYRVWEEWYPEANAYIWKNNVLPFRTKFIEWMAAKGQWWFIRLYYHVVYKIIYKIKYQRR